MGEVHPDWRRVRLYAHIHDVENAAICGLRERHTDVHTSPAQLSELFDIVHIRPCISEAFKNGSRYSQEIAHQWSQ